MLREGFDVNNICVIVPCVQVKRLSCLNRLWEGACGLCGGNDYDDIKQENRIKLLQKKQEPSNYLDILSIIEHPRLLSSMAIERRLVNEAGDMKAAEA